MSTLAPDVNADLTSNATPALTKVEAGAPFKWIQQGVLDFRSAPLLSLLYGALFAGFCAAVYIAIRNAPWFTLAYLTGLVVVGPFVAAGLYAANRDMERGLKPSIRGSLRVISKRKTYLALFALMLTLLMAAWVRFSALLFAVASSTLTPTADAYAKLLSSPDGWLTLAFFVGAGMLLVTVVFVFSAVSIPYILDKDVNFIEAMSTSYRTVINNPAAMLIWAGAIVVLTAAGIATAFIGLAVIFPVLGYATWHSYRALVK